MSSRMNAFAAFAAALTASACVADPMPVQRVSRSVEVSDLNLNRPADAERALFRIKTSAHLACRPKPDYYNYYALEDYERCVADAIEGAVRRADVAALTAAYEGERHMVVVQHD